MNVVKAQKIAQHVAKIAELATSFHARFGTNFRLNEESPAQAWEMYRSFMAEQAQIAALLDLDALAKPYYRWEKWWERRDVMNTGLVNELATEAIRLVERAAYIEAVGEAASEDAMRVIQEGIAGLLHPMTRQLGLDHVEGGMAEAI